MKHKAAATALAASALLVAGAAQAKPQPLFQDPAAAPVNGLIVRLRDAPAHEEVEREQALSRERRSARGEKHRERLQRVLREAAMDRAAIDVPSAPAISATGRASQVLRFDKPLTLEQAQRLARRLAARGDVLWVEPNVRERRLQSTSPNDPDFVSSLQWWLQPLNAQSNSDVNALPIEQRLRGVPRFSTAWTLSNGTGVNVAATRVAVLDSGITEHEDLAGRWIGGYDFVSTVAYAGDGNGRDADPHDPGDFVSASDISANPALFSGCTEEDSKWHGTKIAGLIAALTNNGVGVAGANQANLIVPVRVLGKCGADVSDITDGIRWAAGLPVSGVPANPNPARIINLSVGGSAACGNEYQDAIEAVRQVGAVVVAAAGNEHTAPTRPANCSNSNVIGVGALNRDGFKAVYSNFGTLTVSTVGGDPDTTKYNGAWNSFLGDGGLWTTTNTGLQSPLPLGSSYTNEDVIGTSFSAPLVSATISLMLGRNSALTADQIVAGLKASARPHVVTSLLVNGAPAMASCSDANPGRCICTTTTCGAGILDAYEALNYAANPTGYTAPTRTAADINTAELLSARQSSTQDLPANQVPSTPTTPAGPCGRDGICGGATQPAWLLGLLAASGALLWGGRRLKKAQRRG